MSKKPTSPPNVVQVKKEKVEEPATTHTSALKEVTVKVEPGTTVHIEKKSRKRKPKEVKLDKDGNPIKRKKVANAWLDHYVAFCKDNKDILKGKTGKERAAAAKATYKGKPLDYCGKCSKQCKPILCCKLCQAPWNPQKTVTK